MKIQKMNGVNLIKCLAAKVSGWLSLNSKSAIFQIYHGENKLHVYKMNMRVRVRVMVFNATFSNISIISWRSVLLVEKTWVPG
jgi:hypothetical protein